MKKSGIILLIAAVIMVGCTKLDSRGFNEKKKTQRNKNNV